MKLCSLGWRYGVWLLCFLLVAQVHAQEATLDSIGTTGTRAYRAQHWAQLQAFISNEGMGDTTPMLAVSLDEMVNAQFATRAWVPAQAKRRVTLPIYLSVNIPKDQRSWPMSAQLIDESGASEARLGRPSEGLLPIYIDPVSTLAITDGDASRKVIRALRTDRGSLGPATLSVTPSQTPRHPAGFDGVDTMLIAHSEPNFNEAQLDALRHWLVAGGRLWIMLDTTPVDLGEQLLGDHFGVAALDRIELTKFDLISRGARENKIDSFDLDDPVHLLRVWADDWQVTHTVGDYPAALRRTIGDGEVFLSMLDAEAWVKPGDPEPVLTDALKRMGDWLRTNNDQVDHGPVMPAIQPFVTQQVGYSILSISRVVVVLAIYILALFVAAIVFSKRDRLERLAPVGILLAIVAGGLLVMLGYTQQSSQSTTLATMQIGRYTPGQPVVQWQTLAGIYQSPPIDPTLQVEGDDGIAWPSLNAQGGQTMRYVSHGNAWSLEQLNLPPGALTEVQTAATHTLTSPAKLVVSWGEDGSIRGRIQGDAPARLDDAVIASTESRHAVSFSRDGELFAALDSALTPGNFINATVLSQTQQSRLAVYRSLFQTPYFVPGPSLVGWTGPHESSIALGDQVEKRSDAMVVLPIETERPPPGGKLTLPAAMLRMSVPRNVKGLSYSTVFDEKNRTFNGNISTEMDVVLRFDLPEGLMPITLDRVELDFDITALGRDVTVVVYRNGAVHEVETLASPSQPVSVALSGEDLPEVQPGGWVALGLRVGPLSGARGSGWSLRRMEPHLIATSQEESRR